MMIARAAFLTAVALVVYFQEVGLELRREERRAWWAGTGRDLLNAAGTALLAFSLHALGCPWPAALFWSGTLTLVLFGLYLLMANQLRTHRPRLWALLAGIASAIPLAFWPDQAASVFADAAQALFSLPR